MKGTSGNIQFDNKHTFLGRVALFDASLSKKERAKLLRQVGAKSVDLGVENSFRIFVIIEMCYKP